MSVSIYTVAKRAGVSISTVSRILNGNVNVSEKKRAAVQEAMEFYQYEPNQFARGLVKQESRMIGIYFPLITSSVFESSYSLELLKGAEEVLTPRNYSMLLISEQWEEHHRNKRVPKYIEFVRQKKIDGLLLSGLSDKPLKDEVMQELLDLEYPMVYIGKKFHKKGLNVYAQYSRYNLRMVETLYQQGHRKILFLMSGIHQPYWEEIQAKVGERMPEVRLQPAIIEKFDPEEDDISWLIKKWVVAEGYTAVCSPSMVISQVLLGECTQLGLSVPGRVSIISVEHKAGEGQILYPAVSAVFVPARAMGSGAAHLLLDAIQGTRQSEQSLEYEPEYIERDSIGRII